MAEPILFISRQRLVGRTNGSSAYLLDLAETARASGFMPILLQPTPRVCGRWPMLRMRPEMRVFARHRIRGLLRLGPWFVSFSPRVWVAAGWGMLARAARKLGARGGLFADRPFPYVVAEPWTDADRGWLARKARRAGRVAIADYMFCAEGFAQIGALRASAIVMHELFHSRPATAADTVVTVDREIELALLDKADAVIAIQADEARFVGRHLPEVETILAPMAATIAPAPAPGEDDRLLFVGSNTGPNIEGLRWFLAEAWPQVRAARPGARLEVAGTVAWSFAGAVADGVRFLGMVGDLAPIYAQAGVVISPLTFGSGLKIKLIEAMAQGKAIVATPVTLQGVEGVCAGAVLRAEPAEEFAAAIIALAGDGAARGRLAQAARDRARAHFGRETCHAAFAAWLLRAVRA